MQRFGDIIISPSPSDFFYTIYHRALTLANITETDFILIGGQNDIFEYGLIDRPKQLQESGYQLICPELGDCEHFRKPKHIAATFFGGIKGTTLLPSQYRKNKTVELYDYPWVVEKDNEVVSIVVSETQKSIFREVSRCSKKMHQIELADGFEDVA
ncbi:Oidioi.mRNA.OKI2018_I69.XSR.g15706.t1.cds [Oikopleura dioica]|uniref:Oidioi.mRNA.OKI2018_I69.XSR.g15706.t1.cds n=1 Tax=Oikopleura dioica TaxID=34765 RepID=A0ABN7SDP6_OIKDI|nr:Oidioi.mRNA.OKI2018_I69.XSR.g15706.t1.cds [Oikopleura dioica]